MANVQRCVRLVVIVLLLVCAPGRGDVSITARSGAGGGEPPFLLVAGNQWGLHVVERDAWTVIRGNDGAPGLRIDRLALPRALLIEEVVTALVNLRVLAVARVRSGPSEKWVVLEGDHARVRIVLELPPHSELVGIGGGDSVAYVVVRDRGRDRYFEWTWREPRFTERAPRWHPLTYAPRLDTSHVVATHDSRTTTVATISRLPDGTRRVATGEVVETRMRAGWLETRCEHRAWLPVVPVAAGEELLAFPELTYFIAISRDLTRAVRFHPHSGGALARGPASPEVRPRSHGNLRHARLSDRHARSAASPGPRPPHRCARHLVRRHRPLRAARAAANRGDRARRLPPGA